MLHLNSKGNTAFAKNLINFIENSNENLENWISLRKQVLFTVLVRIVNLNHQFQEIRMKTKA